MKAIIRARASQRKSRKRAIPSRPQRQRLVDYCARKGLKMINTYELVEPSTRGERKEFAAMLVFGPSIERNRGHRRRCCRPLSAQL
jgi:DNA invertase Pin-like site-specific DNA recombinase